jgi:subtilisin family serine protease
VSVLRQRLLRPVLQLLDAFLPISQLTQAPAGLDYSNCFFHDPNAGVPVCADNGTSHNCKNLKGRHRKIVSYRYLADTAEYVPDLTFGHGTHVAGTIAGNAQSSMASEEDYARKYNGCVHNLLMLSNMPGYISVMNGFFWLEIAGWCQQLNWQWTTCRRME